MINLFFVPGMFGSTIEYVLRTFTQEYEQLAVRDNVICKDGSMHAYKKQFHHNTLESVKQSISRLEPDSISTPIYPFSNQHLPEILSCYQSLLDKSSNILIHADSLRGAELNLLFQYYKIAFGSNLQLGLDIFCGDNGHDIIKWNPKFCHWSEMQVWELREWFSLFYPGYVQEWIESVDQVPDTFCKVSNTDILYNIGHTVRKIIRHCKLTELSGLDEFLETWCERQLYIVEKFDLLDQIVESTLQQQNLSWSALDVVCESIIQQRLRAKKHEIRCDGLNIFPTDSKTLYNLLERC